MSPVSANCSSRLTSLHEMLIASSASGLVLRVTRVPILRPETGTRPRVILTANGRYGLPAGVDAGKMADR